MYVEAGIILMFVLLGLIGANAYKNNLPIKFMILFSLPLGALIFVFIVVSMLILSVIFPVLGIEMVFAIVLLYYFWRALNNIIANWKWNHYFILMVVLAAYAILVVLIVLFYSHISFFSAHGFILPSRTTPDSWQMLGLSSQIQQLLLNKINHITYYLPESSSPDLGYFMVPIFIPILYVFSKIADQQYFVAIQPIIILSFISSGIFLTHRILRGHQIPSKIAWATAILAFIWLYSNHFVMYNIFYVNGNFLFGLYLMVFFGTLYLSFSEKN